mmetsp:Transcript_53221/g.142371  ORF Transcript_53221/g.142371 Transcript_53221/m.142371 type:complete len:222 (+) Transcript_53221:310-975(+)
MWVSVLLQWCSSHHRRFTRCVLPVHHHVPVHDSLFRLRVDTANGTCYVVPSLNNEPKDAPEEMVEANDDPDDDEEQSKGTRKVVVAAPPGNQRPFDDPRQINARPRELGESPRANKAKQRAATQDEVVHQRVLVKLSGSHSESHVRPESQHASGQEKRTEPQPEKKTQVHRKLKPPRTSRHSLWPFVHCSEVCPARRTLHQCFGIQAASTPHIKARSVHKL